MKKYYALIVFVLLILLARFTPPAYALDMRSGDSVSVQKGDSIEGSLVLSGATVSMDGVVHGDLYCAGQKVTISGTVDGDILCAAQSVIMTGTVSGNLRMVGQRLDIAGVIARNVTVLVQTLTQVSSGRVQGELYAGGQTFSLSGFVNKSVEGFTQNARLDGVIRGNVSLDSAVLEVGDHAVIGGTLHYISDKEATMSKLASISGDVKRTSATAQKKEQTNNKPVKPVEKPWPANALPSIFMYLIVGFLAVWLFPVFTKKTVEMMTTDALGTGLVGALTLMVTPIAALIIFCTLIGIPVAIIVLMAYVIAILLSRIFVAGIVGAYVLDSFGVKQKTNSLLQMVVGVPLLWFMMKAPIIGGLLGFLAVCWGVGGMVRSFGKKKK